MENNFAQIAKDIARELSNIQAEKLNTIKGNTSWLSKLEYDNKGNVSNSISNYITYLVESPKYVGRLKYNSFLRRKEIDGREFNDFDLNIIYNDIERDINLKTRSKVDSALNEVFVLKSYDPVKEYLETQKWDGVERLDRLFIDLLDVEDTLLNRSLTRKWFIAAVKRVYEPGSKFDNILVLQGNQGIGKSTICEKISLSFFNTISLNEIGSKDLIDKLNKTWIAIIDELDTFNKKEMSSIKTFLSLSADSARLAYSRNSQTFKRHCVFIGSTNDDTFLRDTTSSVERRFWILKCNKTTMDGKIREKMTDEYINQIWAEAKTYYVADPNQYLDIEQNMQTEFAEKQKEFKTYNDDNVCEYLDDLLNRDYVIDETGCFTNMDDFTSQCTGFRMVENPMMTNKIDKIPMSWLIFILKHKYNESRSQKYIAQALSSEWEYKSIRYNDKVVKGIIRKSTDEDMPENLF